MSNTAGLAAHAWATDKISSLAERSFFSTMEAASAGTLATDHQARIVWINDKYCRLIGVAAGDLIGQPISSVLPESRIPEVLSTGQPIVLDLMAFGHANYVVSRFPVFDNNKNIIGAFGFVLYSTDSFELFQGRLAQLSSLKGPQEKPSDRRTVHAQITEFAGTSEAAAQIRRLSSHASRSGVSVLITGATGSGKEVVAQSIHARSKRATNNFVAVNVAAIPETLFESEFFGTAPGAFTGADRRTRMGKLQLADGGTLFLDEVGDMPEGTQVKLLRFLETGEFESLGSNRLQRVDVRVIAATSVDLRKAVADKRFRSDLYYRLNVLPIVVPALCDRTEDVGELSRLLLKQIAMRTQTRSPVLLSCAVDRLQARAWPGNVRELRNVLERCSMYVEGASIDAAIVDRAFALDPPEPAAAALEAGPQSLAEAVAVLERERIAAALVESEGSIANAAQALRISRTTLYKKAKQLGLLET